MNSLKEAVRLLLMVVTAAGSASGRSWAADGLQTNLPATPTKADVSVTEQLKALKKEVDDAEAAYVKETDSEKDDKLWLVYGNANKANIPRVIELVRQDPTSTVAFEMLEWVVTNRQVRAGSRLLRPYGLQAVELLKDHYTTNPKLSRICWVIGHNWDFRHQPTFDFLQAVIAKNPDRNARGYATFALAALNKKKAEDLEDWENAPLASKQNADPRYRDYVRRRDSKADSREAEQLFNTVVEKYADCLVEGPPASSLGEKASPELYELRNLSAGKVAPEIEAEDLDGKKFKLSDYRGKIVVLSFWGSRCVPCMRLVPLERSLVERMIGNPFALIGVNSDVDRTDAKRTVEKEKITWRSFWDGTNGDDGPISKVWNVKSWPTVFVLDPKGEIQFKFIGFGGTNTATLMNESVDRLLNELEGQKKGTKN
jgi:thiol-disulfide isomerase/thioredoxin